MPTEGLMAYWPFNGNANDESGNGHNGTVYGATLTTDRKGNPNKAYSFDGINDYIGLGTISTAGYTGITVSLWLKPVNINEVIKCMLTYSGYFVCYYSRFTPGKFFCLFDGSSGGEDETNESSTTMAIENWYHLVGTNDGIYTRLYVNGILENTFLEPIATGSQNSFIGKSSSGQFTNGSIDDIRIYNRALTEQEITALYNE